MNERHGGLWREDERWQIVYERHDAATDTLAVVMSREELGLLKADLFMRVDYGEPYLKPFWDGCAESLFDANDLPEAINHLERVLQNRFKTRDLPQAQS